MNILNVQQRQMLAQQNWLVSGFAINGCNNNLDATKCIYEPPLWHVPLGIQSTTRLHAPVVQWYPQGIHLMQVPLSVLTADTFECLNPIFLGRTSVSLQHAKW